MSQNIAQIKLDMLKLEEETESSLQNIRGSLFLSILMRLNTNRSIESINSVWESLGLMGSYLHFNQIPEGKELSSPGKRCLKFGAHNTPKKMKKP